ncbi:solute carrier family 4 (anion exchanger), member 1, adaptor protein (predicted), isoform CRA_e [Rattus norvegicus]|nr:solute carrier family 4 (anion exchanger), member 1, adaptor protein (predicted), isoform CRA_e [Rattus norvegicus]
MQMKDEPEVEEEEEEEEEEKAKEEHEEGVEDGGVRLSQGPEPEPEAAGEHPGAPPEPSCSKETKSHAAPENECKKDRDELKKKKSGPGKFPPILSSKYPEDDPDYCVWVPPEGQSGDGRTHLNDKYGY